MCVCIPHWQKNEPRAKGRCSCQEYRSGAVGENARDKVIYTDFHADSDVWHARQGFNVSKYATEVWTGIVFAIKYRICEETV